MQCVRHEFEEALGICHRCDLPYCRECLIMDPPDFLCANCHKQVLDLCAAEETALTYRSLSARWGLILAGIALALGVAILWWAS